MGWLARNEEHRFGALITDCLEHRVAVGLTGASGVAIAHLSLYAFISYILERRHSPALEFEALL